MSIAAFMKRMRELGAPPEAIEFAVEALAEQQRKAAEVEAAANTERSLLAARRKADAERQQRRRDGLSTPSRHVTSRDVTGHHATSGDPSPKTNVPPHPPINSSPNQTPLVGSSEPTAPEGAGDAELPGLVDPVEAGAAPAAQPGAEPPKAKSEPRARRLTVDFADSPEARAVCAEMGLNEAEADAALAEFCDYWLAEGGQKARKIDWPRTLRNRLREMSRRRPPPGRPLPRGQPERPLSPAARRALFLRDLSRGSDAPDDETDPSLDDDGPIIDHEGDGGPDRPLPRPSAGDPRQFPAQGHLRFAGAHRR